MQAEEKEGVRGEERCPKERRVPKRGDRTGHARRTGSSSAQQQERCRCPAGSREAAVAHKARTEVKEGEQDNI